MLVYFLFTLIFSLTAPASPGQELIKFEEIRLDVYSERDGLFRQYVQVNDEWFQVVTFKNFAASVGARVIYPQCWVAYRVVETANVNPDGLYASVLYCTTGTPDNAEMPTALKDELIRRFHTLPSAPLEP